MKFIKTFESFSIEQDEFGNNVVWRDVDNGYKITINKTINPTYIALFYHDKRVGAFSLRETAYDKKQFFSVEYIEIDKEHRSRGFGKKMYDIALKFMSDDVEGIISDLANRANKTQIPAIYKRLGGWEDEQYAILPRDRYKKRDEIYFKPVEEIAKKFNVKPRLIETLIQGMRYNYNTKRHSIEKLISDLKLELTFILEYGHGKPKDYGYGRRSVFVEDIKKITNITKEDIFE